MDQQKIDTFNDQKKLQAEERAKTEDMALAVSLILDSQKDVKQAIGLTLQGVVKFLKQYKPEVSISNPQEIPDIQPVVDSVTGLIKETNKKQADFSKVVEGLNNVSIALSKLPTKYPDPPTIPEPIDYSGKFDELKKAIQPPVVNIPKQDIKIPDYSKELQSLQKSVENIKIPEVPKTDFSSVEKAVKGVTETIRNLRFPVPNYMLPFKNSAGAATQVQLDSSGYLPVSATLSETFYTVRIDASDATTTYLGNALPGATEGAASWQIKKIDSNNPTNIKFADGNSNFDNVWTNRVSLSYS